MWLDGTDGTGGTREGKKCRLPLSQGPLPLLVAHALTALGPAWRFISILSDARRASPPPAKAPGRAELLGLEEAAVGRPGDWGGWPEG